MKILNNTTVNGKDVAVGYYYVVGNTGGTAGTWTGTIDGLTAYYEGLTIAYKIGTAGASTTTLNINGLGAKTCKRNNSNLTTQLGVNTVVILTYDGVDFQWADYDSTNYYEMRSSGYDLVGADPVYSYKIVAEGSDGSFYPLTLETGTGIYKTVSTRSLKVGGKIRGYTTTATISAGATTRYYFGESVTVNCAYTLNDYSGLVTGKSVYIKGLVQADGSYKLDNSSYTSFYTQDLPTTEDGYIYIQLGTKSTTTSLRITPDHPIFEFKNGALRPYVAISNATTSIGGLLSSTDKSKLDGIALGATANTGTVTSVGLSAPTGLTVSGSPVTTSGTLALSFTSGYSIPTTAKQGDWDSAYTHSTSAHAPSDANNYVHPTTAGNKHIPTSGATSNVLVYGGSSGTASWSAMSDTIHGTRGGGTQHSAVTTSVNGFMSSGDKTKLDGIANNANNYTHPNHSGDVTSTGDGATVIGNNKVTDAMLAKMATATIKGRKTAGTGNVEALTKSDVLALLNVADGAQVNQTISSGNGMNFTGGSGNVTITLGTPSALSASTTDAVTASSHTHSISGFALTAHNHAAGNITSGTLGVARGGTGVATITTGQVMIGNGTGAITSLTRSGIDNRATFPPASHTHSTIPVEMEIVDTTCYPVFVKDVTGSLEPKIHPTLSFNSLSAELSASVFKSTVATGTAPFAIASTTKVDNLNADMVDGIEGADLIQTASYTIPSFSWARLAVCSAGNVCHGIFKLRVGSGTTKASLIFMAGIQNVSYLSSTYGCSLVLLENNYAMSALISSIRLVGKAAITSVDDAYIEVYNSQSIGLPIEVELINGKNWNFNTSYSAGSIPSGFFEAPLTLDTGISTLGNIRSSGGLFGTRGTFSQATGTSPLSISSTTRVPNLNADYLDGYHASSFLLSGSGQIPFPSAQTSSSDPNTLDDYEEGTFTPSIQGSTTAGIVSYGSRAGKYIKIGGLVWIGIDMSWYSHSGTGNMVIKGLPFSAIGYGNAVAIRASNMTLGSGYYGVQGFAWGTTIDIERWNGTTQGGLPMDTSAGLIISGVYSVV